MKTFGGASLSVDNFLAALRPALNQRRAAIVNAAWDRIAEGGASATLARLQECYDESCNADFLDGKLTKEQIFS